ncbi:MAG TPA: hypothetical protein DCL80_01850, partial [Balneola sp.]|nr:hypothetical protein [Balneola sp.]
FLKPFGTPADMPGAMAEADRAAEVLAAKQELSIAKEETEATAKARIAQKKYLKKLREVKYADVRSSFKSAMSEQWGDIIVDDEGEIISIDKAYTGSNKQRFKTAIGKIRLEGMRKKAQGVPLEIIGRYYIDKLAGLKKNPLYQKKK